MFVNVCPGDLKIVGSCHQSHFGDMRICEVRSIDAGNQ